MIDINLIRRDAKKVEESLRKRDDIDKIELLYQVKEKDEKYRSLLQQEQALRKKRNELINEVNQLRGQGKDFKAKAKQVKKIAQDIKGVEEETKALKEELGIKLLQLPNVLHPSVPVGHSDEENKVMKLYGKKPKFSFKTKNHVELMQSLDLADLDRAAKISQSRFYFLKNELALLDFALMNYALDFLRKKGFTFLIPPAMMNRKAYSGVTDLDDFENVMYKVEGEDLYVIATAEHPLIAMHANEVFEVKDLPLKYCGFSTNFRKEVGAHGITDRGIWRVHQFNKIEMIIFSHPEDSWKHHDFLAKIVEEFFSSLEIHFRKVNVCTGDIGSVAAKKYDYEAWIPSASAFKEIASCSNCTDYQANRLGIRYRTNEGNKALHTLNSTCVATTRAAVAILENLQQEDGSITLPKALRKYMGGLKAIKAPKPAPKKPAKKPGKPAKGKK